MKKLLTLGLLLFALHLKASPNCITNVTVTASSGAFVAVANSQNTGIEPYTDGYGNKGFKGVGLYSTGTATCNDPNNGVIVTVYKNCGAAEYIDIHWECNPNNVANCSCDNNCRTVIVMDIYETSKSFKIVHVPGDANNCSLSVCVLGNSAKCIPAPEQ